jgi:glycosyltransferase involved in cell wall biosynthesis
VSTPRKVGIVVPGGLDPSGEINVIPALIWIVERLARRRGPRTVSAFGATLHLPANSGFAAAWKSIRAEHLRRAFDLFHGFWAGRPGLVAAAAGRFYRRPCIMHVAGGELVSMPDIEYGGFLRLRGRASVRTSLALATSITAASEAVRGEIMALGRPSQRLPLGVDLGRWPPLTPRPRSEPARLIHVGSLNRIKDHAMLLDAAHRLAHGAAEFHLDLVGVDTLGGELQRRAARMGLAMRVTFHGFLPQRDLRPLMERAHVHLVSSRHEAGPVSMLEAAAAGVPTVGTAVGHVADWAPEAAIAVPVGDSRALALAVAGVLADDERRLTLAAKAQARAVEEDADWTVRRIDDLYGELLGDHGEGVS